MPSAEGADHIDLAVDANGNRYTTHAFAKSDDLWCGATILTPSVVRDLRERGLLPLTECVIPPGPCPDTGMPVESCLCMTHDPDGAHFRTTRNPEGDQP